MSASASGTILDGRYELLDQLDQGGMATVYRARDLRLERPVAVKVLEEARRDVAGLAFREDRLTARLNHPHIVSVYDGGTTPDGQPFLVMELIDGRPVTDLAPLPVGQALRIAEDVAAAVAYTHERGIVHCDIKPQNVLLDRHGQAKLADFGIASADRAPSGAIVHGSAPYLAPERLRGAPVSPAVDIYALGGTLAFLLSGRHPGDGPPPDLPPDAAAIVRRATAADPGDRYPTAAALRDDLAALRHASGQPTSALRIVPAPATAAGPGTTAAAADRTPTTALPGTPHAATTTVLPAAPPPPDPPAAPAPWVGLARRAGAVRLPRPGWSWLVAALAALLILLILVAGGRALGAARAGGTGATAEVPSLANLGPGQARDLLRAQGLRLGRVDTAPLAGRPAGGIVYQRPAAGARARPGTAVDVVVGTAP